MLRCTPEDEVIYKRDWLVDGKQTQAGKIQLFFVPQTKWKCENGTTETEPKKNIYIWLKSRKRKWSENSFNVVIARLKFIPCQIPTR